MAEGVAMAGLRSCLALVALLGLSGCAGMKHHHHSASPPMAGPSPRMQDVGPVDPFLANKAATSNRAMGRYFPALSRQEPPGQEANNASQVAARPPAAVDPFSADEATALEPTTTTRPRRQPGLLTRWLTSRKPAPATEVQPTLLPARDDRLDLSSASVEVPPTAPIAGHRHAPAQQQQQYAPVAPATESAATLPLAIEIPISRETAYVPSSLPPVVRYPSAKRRSNLLLGAPVIYAATPAVAQNSASRDDQARQVTLSTFEPRKQVATPAAIEPEVTPAEIAVPAQEAVFEAAAPLAEATLDSPPVPAVAVPAIEPAPRLVVAEAQALEPVAAELAPELVPAVTSASPGPALQPAIEEEQRPFPAASEAPQALPAPDVDATTRPLLEPGQDFQVQDLPGAPVLESQVQAPSIEPATSVALLPDPEAPALAADLETGGDPVLAGRPRMTLVTPEAPTPSLPQVEFPAAYYEEVEPLTSIFETSGPESQETAAVVNRQPQVLPAGPELHSPSLGQRVSQRFRAVFAGFARKQQPAATPAAKLCANCQRTHQCQPEKARDSEVREAGHVHP